VCRLGIWLFCIPSFRGGYWVATISPIYVFAQIMGISGVPLQEKQQKERWGDDPAFQEYRRNTWLLLPLPQCAPPCPSNQILRTCDGVLGCCSFGAYSSLGDAKQRFFTLARKRRHTGNAPSNQPIEAGASPQRNVATLK